MPRPDRGVERGGARALGDWIQGRSYAAVLRQPSILGRIETVQADGTAGEARFELADSAGARSSACASPRCAAPPDGCGAGPHAPRYPAVLHFTDITHLREAEEMRRDFVANVSHELRTPLTAVLGFIETLRGPGAGRSGRAGPVPVDHGGRGAADEPAGLGPVVAQPRGSGRTDATLGPCRSRCGAGGHGGRDATDGGVVGQRDRVQDPDNDRLPGQGTWRAP
jgi:hypothetical protein